jgi:hypothetical protein
MFRKWLLAAVSLTLPAFAATGTADAEELAAHGEALAWDAIWDVHDTAELAAGLEDADAVLSSNALAVQNLQANTVTDIAAGHRAEIDNSFNDSLGVIGVNQSTGGPNNQANVYAASFASADVAALRLNDADVVQRLRDNGLTSQVDSLTAGIHGSFNATSGVVGVNQAAGSLNNQANMVALTFGDDAGPAGTLLSEAVLAQVGNEGDNSFDKREDTETNATITDSFNDFNGVAQVNQVAGNFNQVANVLGVSVNANP